MLRRELRKCLKMNTSSRCEWLTEIFQYMQSVREHGTMYNHCACVTATSELTPKLCAGKKKCEVCTS